MIQDFLASWDLFANVYLSGWLIAALLALVGVVVVARDQIFLGAAVAQASTLGIAVTLLAGALAGAGAGHWIEGDAVARLMAVVFAMAAAVVAGGRPRIGRESRESVTGWVFLVSAALAILVVAHSPHGVEEVHRLVASSIIGATGADVAVFALLLAVTVAVVALAHRAILLLVMDPETASVVGVRVRAWEWVIALWLGLTLGLALRASGLLYAFGCLILPALIAKNLCRRVRPMFLAAPLIALAGAVASFVLAHHYDLPPAQTTVALLGVLMAPAWAFRALRTTG